jgi:hypothetical protein
MLRNLKAIGVETKALTALEVLVFKEQTVKRIDGMNKGIADILEKNPQLKATFDIFGDFDQKVKKIEGFRPLLGPIRNVSITSEKAAELLEVLGQQMNLTQINALGMAESVGTGNQATSEATQEAKDQFMALASLVAILTQQDLIYKQLADTIAELSVNQDEVTVKIVTFKSAMQDLSKGGRLAVKAFDRIGDAFAQAALTATTFEEAGKRAINSIAATILSKAATFALLRVFFPTALGFGTEGTTPLSFGKFLAGSLGIKHKGGEVQRFSSGGSVRGRDNVPILAQAGEFIIRRDSAQSIGLDSLRQMNETGQPSSNIVVNIHGGVVQDDYVRNELIPALNSAVNSGARIDA